ncbi:RAD51D-like protein 1 [Schizosaccharomyces japonicus yFS275]|uniref:RAD51D-like protein 1 n=1 Tax=Schizosaccharomyces japonicus (strain yFS275 / FY16936) TaxID=402676 RepID=B6K1R9_SCHJY|nr:RAD51D-like protein 1 [Schizosaccharomyces japonicus yFS275]EEB07100.1 RAD51D-like protein 1 [Schizosaccharomyces japonicus yFS275]
MNEVTQFSGDSANLVLYWVMNTFGQRFKQLLWIDTLGTFNPTMLSQEVLQKTNLMRCFDAHGVEESLTEVENILEEHKNGSDFSCALIIDSFSIPLGLLMSRGLVTQTHALMMHLGRKMRMLTRTYPVAVFLSTAKVYIPALNQHKPALGASWTYCLDNSFMLDEQPAHSRCTLVCLHSRRRLSGTKQLLLWMKGTFRHEQLAIDFFESKPMK